MIWGTSTPISGHLQYSLYSMKRVRAVGPTPPKPCRAQMEESGLLSLFPFALRKSTQFARQRSRLAHRHGWHALHVQPRHLPQARQGTVERLQLEFTECGFSKDVDLSDSKFNKSSTHVPLISLGSMCLKPKVDQLEFFEGSMGDLPSSSLMVKKQSHHATYPCLRLNCNLIVIVNTLTPQRCAQHKNWNSELHMRAISQRRTLRIVAACKNIWCIVEAKESHSTRAKTA